MSYNWPKTFHLKRGDQLLAILKSCKSKEMFWAVCEIERVNESFAEIEEIIRAATEALDANDIDRYESYYGQLDDMEVKLFDQEDDVEAKYFIMHFSGDDIVSLRF